MITHGIVYIYGLLISLAAVVNSFEPVKCFKDKDLGDYPVNVYYCDEEDKPECCELEEKFTCCTTDGEKNFNEQVQLWGLIGILVVIGAFVMVCWRKDTYLCEGASVKDRCGKCCCCKKDDDKDGEIDDFPGSREIFRTTPLPPGSRQRVDANPNYKLHNSSAAEDREDNGGAVTARNVEPVMQSSFNPYDPDCQVHATNNLYQGSEVDSGRGSTLSLDTGEYHSPKGKSSPSNRPKNDEY